MHLCVNAVLAKMDYKNFLVAIAHVVSGFRWDVVKTFLHIMLFLWLDGGRIGSAEPREDDIQCKQHPSTSSFH